LLPDKLEKPLRIKLLHTAFGKKPKYEALLYTWGSSLPVERIEIDSTPVDTRRNLYDALRCLRDRKEERTLWIDTICIN